MKRTAFFTLFLTFFFQSCNTEKISVIGLDFVDTCTLTKMDTTRIILEDYGFPLFYTKYGYISGREKDSEYIQLWDINTGEKLFGFGRIGNGPNEFLMPICTDVDYEDNKIFVLDLITQKCSIYKLLSDTLEFEKQVEIPGLIAGSLVQFLNDSTLVYRKHEGATPRLGIKTIGSDKVIETEDNILNIRNINNAFSVYQSAINLSKKKGKIILRCPILNTISCYSVRNESLILDWRQFLVEPKFTIDRGEFKLVESQMNSGIVQYCTVSDNYIYVLILKAK